MTKQSMKFLVEKKKIKIHRFLFFSAVGKWSIIKRFWANFTFQRSNNSHWQ